MRYFKHHIGDYAAATQHLSFVEDAAYHRMMRHYYQTEKPLLSDLKALARVLGARTKEEKEAVATVVSEFFTLESDGFHQRRCDAEIESQREKSRKASEAGKMGGRPNKEAKPLENNKTTKAGALPLESERSPDEKLPTNHYPLTIKDKKDSEAAAAAPSASPRAPGIEPPADSLEFPPHLRRAPDAPRVAMASREETDVAFALWMPVAYELRIPEPMFMNPARRDALRARLAECGGIEGWKLALERLREAKFLRDDDDPSKPKHWVNLATLCKPENFTGLMEGRYADRLDSAGHGPRGTAAAALGIDEA